MSGLSGLITSKTRIQRTRKKNGGPGNRPAAQALQWLAHDDAGSSVLATAQQLLQAEEVVRAALPPVLALTCRVASIDRQRITLAVPAAAHATRLRQLTPTLLRKLVSRGWNLTQMDVRVQAGLAPYVRPKPPREVRPLDAAALNCFQDLKQNVAPGPLADAIHRLLTHHGVKN